MGSQDSIFSGKFCLDILRNPIAMTINERTNLDRAISPIWAVLFAIFYVIALGVYFPIFLSNIFGWEFYNDFNSIPIYMLVSLIAGLSVFIAYILFIILIYLLIDRQNKHFIREKNLRMNIISFLVAANNVAKGKVDISEQISGLYSVDHKANMMDKQRSAIGWMLFFLLFPILLSPFLSILLLFLVIGSGIFGGVYLIIILLLAVPVVVIISLLIYVFNFLMNGIYDHDRRWDTFIQHTEFAMNVMGYDSRLMYHRLKLPKRAIFLYTLISILTFGLFLPYWFYILINDPNNHFKRQWDFEDLFLRSISTK